VLCSIINYTAYYRSINNTVYLLAIQDRPGQPNSFLHSCCSCLIAAESSQCHNTHKTTLNSNSSATFRSHVLHHQTMRSSCSCHITNESKVDSRFVVTRLSIPYDYTGKSIARLLHSEPHDDAEPLMRGSIGYACFTAPSN
jgi:hypothetical protein